MKKGTKKLSLSKIQVSKLENSQFSNIYGGTQDGCGEKSIDLDPKCGINTEGSIRVECNQ